MSKNILFSCEKQQKFSSAQIVPDHVLVHIVSGKVEFQFNDRIFVANPKDSIIIHRNRLGNALKLPDNDREPCKTISIFLTQEIIRSYAAQNGRTKQEKYTGTPFVSLCRNPLIAGYFNSLYPYLSQPDKLSEKMIRLKIMEAIELLLDSTAEMESFLFDLSEPHKIDIEKFINENYMFNISLSEFARLTGRSLSTFNRDFKRVFQDTPEHWLRNRRLDEVKYLITCKQQAPSEVFYHVGFENYSHFSAAFKQKFGINVSEMSKSYENK